MTDTPIVSVLMTCYNREKYIGTAIKSVLASTFTDLELIIVDDCSKDNTLKIARSFADADPRVRIYLNDVNLGDYPNRNKAASYAKGKFLKYVDSDDYIYPWALETMIRIMEQFPDAGWGLCSMEPNRDRFFPFELTPKEAYEYNYIGNGLFMRAPLSSIIKREIFNRAGGFKPIRMAGDFEMWHRLALVHNVVLMPQGMVWYRSHDEQEFNDYDHYHSVYEKIKVEYLDSEDFPLGKLSANAIRKKERRKIYRSIALNLLKLNLRKLNINFSDLKIYR